MEDPDLTGGNGENRARNSTSVTSVSSCKMTGDPTPTLTVTVAIPTYRRAALLRQTLEGLVRQDYPPHLLELLIIDNNSPDETPAVVASFANAPLPPRHVLETQQGANHARNRAIREGKWKLVTKYPGGWKLFDMEADRTEQHDLSAQQPELATRLAGGPVKSFLDTHIAHGFGDLAIALIAVLIFVWYARFLYQRKIFLRL